MSGNIWIVFLDRMPSRLINVFNGKKDAFKFLRLYVTTTKNESNGIDVIQCELIIHEMIQKISIYLKLV
ncbi:hypothetical protein DERP_007547 [Dermatophagoides pteronyssinus]|uniref:Uncharacterized protein n=1 Tax=Dermatophagoides pteronyssinus TaxID=6956 RepID=A0ABQ8JK30_DERPT|nr:hypothetical protein DERP_007547 [Dermatophagoides pteronyssinus]